MAVIPYGPGLVAKWHGVRPEAWWEPCTNNPATCPHCPTDPDPVYEGHFFIEERHA